MQIGLRDGRIITLDRAPEGEVVTLQDGERVQRWTRPGAIYTHCLDEQILGADNLFIRAPDSVAGLTQRRQVAAAITRPALNPEHDKIGADKR